MFISKVNSTTELVLFKFQEQKLLKQLNDKEWDEIFKNKIVGMYFGGPYNLIENRVDFLMGYRSNILNLKNLTIPHLNLTGADFVRSRKNYYHNDSNKDIDVIGVFNHSKHKRHEDFIKICDSNDFSSMLMTYGNPKKLSSLERRLGGINSSSTEVLFGFQDFLGKQFCWSSNFIESQLRKAKVLLITSKSEGVNRVAVLAHQLGLKIIIAGDCQGGTYDYLIEKGAIIEKYENQDEAKILIGKLINHKSKYQNQEVYQPVQIFENFLNTLVQTKCDLNHLIDKELHLLIPSHGNLIDRKYVQFDDMFRSLVKLKKYFGLKFNFSDLLYDLINKQKTNFTKLFK